MTRGGVIRAAGVAMVAAAAVAAAAAASPVVFRRRCLTWGATGDDVRRQMPGDALLPNPDTVATRAITIDAPPGAIWPWLVQMGSGRGGAYAYDWIENLLGLSMNRPADIVPDYQNLKIGDLLAVGPDSAIMRVEILEPERALGFRSEDGTWVWQLALYPDGGRTRLVSRNRIATPDSSVVGRLVNRLVMEPGSLVMERRMLRGTKRRAEALARRHRHRHRSIATRTP